MQSKRYHYIKEKYQKKLDGIIVNKTICDGIKIQSYNKKVSFQYSQYFPF